MILSDAEKVVEWRNNKNILKWMFKKNKISVENHIKWFNSRVNRHDYIVLDKKKNFMHIVLLQKIQLNKEY